MNARIRTLLALLAAGSLLVLSGRADPAQSNRVLVLCYHDVPLRAENDPNAVDVPHFIEQIEYMRLHGAHFVSPADIENAHRGEGTLPVLPVLLTFDDGYTTFSTNVLPVLELYNIPALLALCTSWIDRGPPEDIPAPIMNWDQAREVARHPLVTLASHSHDLHKAVPCNPQGNTAHAVVTRIYSRDDGTYESEGAWRERIAADLSRTKDRFETELGKPPRIVVWPYGEYNALATEEAVKAGFRMAFRLQNTTARMLDLMQLDRWMIVDNPDILDFSQDWRIRTELPELSRPHLRAAPVDLNLIYDPDPEQQEKNLGRILDRMVALRPSAVFLQAGHDPDGDGAVNEVYFPNRVLPMRADLLGRVANQFYIRDFKVFVRMPTLALHLSDGDRIRSLRVLESRDGVNIEPASSWCPRLSPFAQDTATLLRTLYEDLASHVRFHGVLFQNDAYLTDVEDFHPDAVKACLAGLSIQGLDPSVMTPEQKDAWVRLKTERLNALTVALMDAVRTFRPQAVFARELYASVLRHPHAETSFAQNYAAALDLYDYTVIPVDPRIQWPWHRDAWIDGLVDLAGKHPRGLDRTLFQFQTYEWRSKRAVPADDLLAWTRRLVARGAHHAAFEPDPYTAKGDALQAVRMEYSVEHELFLKPPSRKGPARY